MHESWQETDSLEGSIFLQDGLRILARIIVRDMAPNTLRAAESFTHPETDITQK